MSKIKSLQKLSKEIGDISAKYAELNWTSYTTGFDFGSEKAYSNLLEVYKNKKNFELICNAKELSGLAIWPIQI